MAAFTVVPLTARFGVEVEGLDTTKPPITAIGALLIAFAS